MTRKIKNKHKRLKIGLFVLLAGVLVFFAYALLVVPRQFEILDYDYVSKDVPKEFDGKKIVFISDIHYEVGYLKFDRVVDEINALAPDIIILGGDYVDHDPEAIAPCFAAISKLRAKDGIFAVLGNHDNLGAVRAGVSKAIRGSNIKLINNNSFWVTEGAARIKIGGVGDIWTDWPDLKKTTSDVKAADLVILDSHNPDYIEELNEDNNIDVMFSGHLHGGQVGFFGWYPVVPSKFGSKYRSGRYEVDGKTLFVSKGAGMNWLPIRFMAKPDVIVVNLAQR